MDREQIVLTNRPDPTNVDQAPQSGSVIIKAPHYKIHSSVSDKAQFIRTAVAIAAATDSRLGVDMSLEMVVDIAQEKGYQIESGEVDAGMLGGYRDKNWDVSQIGDMVVIWQNRGQVLVTPQLQAPAGSNQQLSPVSESITVVGNAANPNEVIEGLAVVPTQEPTQLSQPAATEPIQKQTQSTIPGAEWILNDPRRTAG